MRKKYCKNALLLFTFYVFTYLFVLII